MSEPNDTETNERVFAAALARNVRACLGTTGLRNYPNIDRYTEEAISAGPERDEARQRIGELEAECSEHQTAHSRALAGMMEARAERDELKQRIVELERDCAYWKKSAESGDLKDKFAARACDLLCSLFSIDGCKVLGAARDNEETGFEIAIKLAAKERDALKAELANIHSALRNFELNGSNAAKQIEGIYNDFDATSHEYRELKRASAQLAADLDACKRERDIATTTMQQRLDAIAILGNDLLECKRQRDFWKASATTQSNAANRYQQQLTEKSALCERLKEGLEASFFEGWNEGCTLWSANEATDDWNKSKANELLQRAEGKE